MNILSELESRGWFLSQEGIDILSLENPKTVEEYITLAKDTDLRALSSKGFNKTNEKVTTVPSPCVLQVLEVRNIAVPSVNSTDKPRLLSVIFTDGSKKKYKGVEVIGKVDCIELHTPPGTKYLVKKPIEVKDQILVLGPGMLEKLGGHVQELVQAWRAGKQFLKRFGGKSSTSKEGYVDNGPPAFVPFKVKANISHITPSVESKNKVEKKPKAEKANTADQKNKQNEAPNKSKTVRGQNGPSEQSEQKDRKPKGERKPKAVSEVKQDQDKILNSVDQKPKKKREPKKKNSTTSSENISEEQPTHERAKTIPRKETMEKSDKSHPTLAIKPGDQQKDPKQSTKKEKSKKKDSVTPSEHLSGNHQSTPDVAKPIIQKGKFEKKKDSNVQLEQSSRENQEDKVETIKKERRKRSCKAKDESHDDKPTQAENVPKLNGEPRETTELKHNAEVQNTETKKPNKKKSKSKRGINEDVEHRKDVDKEETPKESPENSTAHIKAVTDDVPSVNTAERKPKNKKKSERKNHKGQAENNQENAEQEIAIKEEVATKEPLEKPARKPRKEKKPRPSVDNTEMTISEHLETTPRKKKERSLRVEGENSRPNKPAKSSNTENDLNKNSGAKNVETIKDKKKPVQQTENRQPREKREFKPTQAEIPPKPSTAQHTPPPVLSTPPPEQPVYYNGAYSDYSYQPMYTPNMDYNVMVPMVDPNTGMTVYGYPQQQYMQPVYYMQDHQQPQPYYNQYIPSQQQQYYDHSTNSRGRGRGRGNNYRGGYDSNPQL